MANQGEDPAAPNAQVVGNAFIQQYYLALHKSPNVVHKFYGDSSVLSRPGSDGEMTTATTVQVSAFENDFSVIMRLFSLGT